MFLSLHDMLFGPFKEVMDLDSLISPTMRSLNVVLHGDRSYGRSGWHHTMAIIEFARSLGAKSILDYGCGRSTLRKSMEAWEDFQEYDPAIKKHSTLPDQADLVVCTDVLEHVEKDRLPAVIDHLCKLAKLGCYVVVATRKSNKTYADGRDTHLIVKGPEWWVKRLDRPRWVIEKSQNILRKDGTPHEFRMWFVK